MKGLQIILSISALALLGSLGLVVWQQKKRDQLQNDLKASRAREGKQEKRLFELEHSDNGKIENNKLQSKETA